MGHVNYYTDPAKKLFYQKTNFMSGINNTTADDLVPDTYEKNIVNFDLNYAGALTKRAGFISHTNASYLPMLNEFNDFENYPTLMKEKNQTLFKDLSMEQGVFQWKDTNTNKEYIVMLYCNQVYVKLSVLSEVKGTAKEYEDWQKIKMQYFDEPNSSFKDYLADTEFETILFKETEDQEPVAVDVPIFSNVYDESKVRRTLVGEAAWDEFVEKDLAKVYKIEGVAYGDAFYLATGYKLMKISSEEGTVVARQIKPIVPTTPEFNTIGGNILSDSPATSIKSSTGFALRVSGIIITSEHDEKPLLKGLVNNPIKFRAITTRPNEEYPVYYRFKYQKQGDTEWTNKYSEHEGWEKITLNSETDIIWEGLLNQATLYNISIEVTAEANINTNDWSIKNAGLIESYVYTGYEVTETPEYKLNVALSIHTCRRLLVYYDQLLAYQDTVDGNVLYISDYRRFDYFPSDYNLIVDTPTKDMITSINFYLNVLVILTENNIFMLKGTNPYTFSLTNINRTIGCKYGWTARVVGNYLYFMSIEGLYKLKSIYTSTEDRLNVEEVDFKIKTLFLDNPSDYIAYSFKGNYYLVELAPYSYDESGNRVSDNGKIYIYDTYLEAWTTYSSLVLNLNNVLVLGNHVCATDRNSNAFLVYPKLQVLDEEFVEYSDGAFYYLDEEDDTKVVRKNDGKLYITTLEETYSAFGKPYHTKKFKEVMLKVMDSHEGKTGLLVTVIVDGAYIVNPEKYEVTVDEETGEVHVEYFTKDNVIRGLNVNYTIETLENVKLPTVTELGKSFILGSAKLGDYDISLHKIKYSGKGKTVKYIIEQVDNKFFGILGHSTVYKEKKPAVK